MPRPAYIWWKALQMDPTFFFGEMRLSCLATRGDLVTFQTRTDFRNFAYSYGKNSSSSENKGI